IQNISYDIDGILNYCQEKDIDDLLTLQLLESMIFLDETIVKLKNLDEKDYKESNKIGEKSEIFSKDTVKNILKGSNSPKYCYAMRMAISVVIGAFIMNYFKLAEGRWILFTILSLTSPLYETSKHKIKYRLVSTLIGSVIIILLFSQYYGYY
ncbi:MAG: FUSC family protein, partial [Methanobrevibacter sp.]|nr:FUSC family protein [Methanobrevibacter sp.]